MSMVLGNGGEGEEGWELSGWMEYGIGDKVSVKEEEGGGEKREVEVNSGKWRGVGEVKGSGCECLKLGGRLEWKNR